MTLRTVKAIQRVGMAARLRLKNNLGWLRKEIEESEFCSKSGGSKRSRSLKVINLISSALWHRELLADAKLYASQSDSAYLEYVWWQVRQRHSKR